MALGASRQSVIRLVVLTALRMATIGAALGTLAAFS